MCNLRIGQRVVCIDAEWRDVAIVERRCPLELNKTYTIVGFGISDENSAYRGVTAGRVNCLLAEVDNPYEATVGFDANRFRPVATRKSDISIFKAMLNPQKQQVTV